MNIDKSMVYKQQLLQIEKEEKQAILNKKWVELAKLSVKKANLEAKIKEIELINK